MIHTVETRPTDYEKHFVGIKNVFLLLNPRIL